MQRIYLLSTILLIIAILVSCKSKDLVNPSPEKLTSSDREKFIGNWAGTYECTNSPGDTLIISAGNSELDFGIILHASTFNPYPVIVSGELTGQNTITVPEQTIGGFPGSATITYSNNVLSLTQNGLGITCQGTYSVKY